MANNIIVKYLENLGLSEVEAKVYLGLQATGSTTILELSRHTNLKRATTHFNVENLIEKGLVSQTRKGAKRLVYAEPLEALNFYLDEKMDGLNELREKLPEILTTIKANVRKNKKEPEVQIKFYEGERGLKLLYNNALTSSEVYTFVDYEKMDKFFQGFKDTFIRNLNTNTDLKVFEVINECEVSREYAEEFKKNDRYKAKFINKDLNLPGETVIIYESKVAILKLGDGLSGVLIVHEDFYNLVKSLFSFVWKQKKEV